MSKRGHITVECDRPSCYAEQHFDANALADTRGFDALVEDAGWKSEMGLDICPECAESEREAAERDDDPHERAADRARQNDFEETRGKDWT